MGRCGMRFWGVRSSVSSLHILTDFRSLTVSLSSTCKICFGAVDGSGFHDVAWKPIPTTTTTTTTV